MAKSKRRTGKRAPNRPSASVYQQADYAVDLYNKGKKDQARQLLHHLVDRFPRNKNILSACIYISQMDQEWQDLLRYGEQILPMLKGEEQAAILNDLVIACVAMGLPALACHYAQELLEQHPGFREAKAIASTANELKEAILAEPFLPPSMQTLTDEARIAAALQHDRIRHCLETLRFEEGIALAQQFLAQYPDHTPVYNNLTLCHLMLGAFDKAEDAVQKVLALDADNFHALGNMARLHFLQGRFTEARTYAHRLTELDSDQPDLPVKRAEIFAYLGDDEQVWAAYESATESDGEVGPLLLHMAAVASFRLGEEKRAWRLWQQAVKQFPGFGLARTCLEEKRLPVGERSLPWYWPLTYWAPYDFTPVLKRHVHRDGQSINMPAFERSLQEWLAERPYFPKIIPSMLELGDQMTRKTIIGFAQLFDSPAFAASLYAFATSSHGADETRMGAIQFITESYPELLPEDRMVTMWREGEPQELLMLGFYISDEPDEAYLDLPKAVVHKHEKAYELIKRNEMDAAEDLLEEIIEDAPDFPPVYNHLALVYERTNRSDEAMALIKETVDRFPDYFFARVAHARNLLRQDQIEEARTILNGMMRQTKLHISEFRSLAIAHIDLAIFSQQPDAARSWLAMWRQIEPDHPEIKEWENRIALPGRLLDTLRQLATSPKRRKKRTDS
jgi:tetratricopeptide (TPR) repeat protein